MNLKKPFFWDKTNPTFLSYLLFPITIIYITIGLILNLKSKKKFSNIKSICVGNIYIGGTGKTPLVIKLFKIIKKFQNDVVTGKKFYKSHIDEQLLLKKHSTTIIKPSRHEVISECLRQKHKVVIFDDGLQDNYVKYDLKIACFKSPNWIGNGMVIPSGPLREGLNSLKKYDLVFVKGDRNENDQIVSSIKNINSKLEIFFYNYSIINHKDFNKNDNYLIFSGIGNPADFKKTINEMRLNIVKEIIFPDHYNFTKSDYEYIFKEAKLMDAKIITTEKDYERIEESDFKRKINYVGIECKIDNESNLIQYLKSIING